MSPFVAFTAAAAQRAPLKVLLGKPIGNLCLYVVIIIIIIINLFAVTVTIIIIITSSRSNRITAAQRAPLNVLLGKPVGS